MPPSIFKAIPVTKEAASESKYVIPLATSSGLANLRKG